MTRCVLILLGLLLLGPGFGLPAAAPANLGGDPALRLLVSEAVPFVGQELVLTLQVRSPRRPSGPMTVVPPDLAAFAVSDLPAPPPFRERTADDGTLLVEEARWLLRPLAPGPLVVAGAAVRCADGRRLEAPPLTLRARPLPAAGRPAGFAGGVGRIALELEAGGTGSREITISLRGNAPLETFPPPHLAVSAGARLIPLGDTFRGRPGAERLRTFRFLYDPAGEKDALPVASLVHFDPHQESYRTVRTAPPTLAGPSLPTLLLLPFGFGLCLAVGLLVRRQRRQRTVEALLQACLGASPAGLSRRRIAEELAARGLAGQTIDLWLEFSRDMDRRRFAPVPSAGGEKGGILGRRLRERLAKEIDKRRGFPYFQRTEKDHH